MFYEKNRKAISVAVFHEPLIEKLDQAIAATDVTLLETEAGDYTLAYKGTFLHSNKGAEAEAKMLADKFVRPGHKIHHTLIGIGLGYVVQAIYEKNNEGHIWIYEPDLSLLRFVLENVDLSEYFETGRVILATNPREMRDIISGYYTYGDTVDVLFSDGYAQMMGSELTRIVRDEIMGPLEIKRSVLGTVFTYQREWNRYFCENIRYFPNLDPFTKLENCFQGKPAFVISAGPSLDKAIEDIKDLKNKAVIIAVGTALRALLAAGIKPDFVCYMDYGGIHKQLAGLEDQLEDVNFILGPFVEPICYQVKTKQRFQASLTNYTEYSDWIEKNIGTMKPKMNSGGTVSVLAFRSARAMGCSPVILLGQDLAISGTQLYAGGVSGSLDETGKLVIPESDQVIAKHLYLEDVKGQNGETLKSPPDYVQYIRDFEQMIRHIRQEEPDFIAYNASTGGAWIEGYQHKPLSELKDILSFSTIDKTLPAASPTGENLTVEEKRVRCVKSLEILISVIKDCLKFSTEARDYLASLKKGVVFIDGKDYERRYLTIHKQFLMRIHSHPVIMNFLQRETWALHRSENMNSDVYEDILANFAAEDKYYESAQITLEYALPAMESSLAELKNMASQLQAV